MKTKIFSSSLIGTLIVLLTACASNDLPRIVNTGVQATLAETIDAYLDVNQSNDEPGLSILVRKDGELVYKKSRGMANKLTGQSITNQTGFRLASVSKPFVALSIMQFYEQQRISLEDSILIYLPELSSSWQSITIHQLLAHRSGIPDFLNDLHLEEKYDDITNQNVLDYFIDNDMLEFTPGSKSDYSNSGYLLLAKIIERITGDRFEDYMLNNLFIHIGMTNSYIADEFSTAQPNDALNYADRSTLWGFNLYINGGDGQVTSIDDMNLFVQALLEGSIVSIETLDLMRQIYSNLEQGNHGYSWFVGTSDQDHFHAGGSMDGFESKLIIEPSKELQYVALSNGGQLTAIHIGNIYALLSQFYSQK